MSEQPEKANTAGRPKRKIDVNRFFDIVRHFKDTIDKKRYPSFTVEYKLVEFSDKMYQSEFTYGTLSQQEADEIIANLMDIRSAVESGRPGWRSHYKSVDSVDEKIEKVKARIFHPTEDQIAELQSLVLELDEKDWTKHLGTIRQQKKRQKGGKGKQLTIDYDVMQRLTRAKDKSEHETWDKFLSYLLHAYEQEKANRQYFERRLAEAEEEKKALYKKVSQLKERR